MPAARTRKRILEQTRRIVVKIGSSAICGDSGRLDRGVINSLTEQIVTVRARGISVTLVTSGAIGAGMGELDLRTRPRTMPRLQAVAAVGQGELMRTFHDAFAQHDVKIAQVLLTRDDFEERTRYLNIRNTLTSLEECEAMAIINENDTVAVDEIRFGDNDVLAALVANMLSADLLVFLTSVDGVIEDGKVLDVIEQVDDAAMSLATSEKSSLGSGGMATKLEAARMVVKAGEVAVIANARTPEVLLRLLSGEKIGTVFAPADRKMGSRRRWIAQASRPTGRIIVDDGAAEALLKRGKSLLPSGITAVGGKFPKGAVVTVLDGAGKQIARGLTNYSAEQLEKIKGLKTSAIASTLGDKPYDEVIHRNNMSME